MRVAKTLEVWNDFKSNSFISLGTFTIHFKIKADMLLQLTQNRFQPFEIVAAVGGIMMTNYTCRAPISILSCALKRQRTMKGVGEFGSAFV